VNDGRFRLVTWNLNCSFRERGEKPAPVPELEPDPEVTAHHREVALLTGEDVKTVNSVYYGVIAFFQAGLFRMQEIFRSMPGGEDVDKSKDG
jgi:hypothetical protein